MTGITLFTDFDGPVVDVSERYYQVYRFCLQTVQHREPQVCPRVLSKSEFWALKRARVAETEIGLRSGLTPPQAEEFSRCRHATVHTFPYFEWDVLLPGVRQVLADLRQQGIDLYVITMRRRRELTFALEQFALTDLFPPNHRYCIPDDFVKTQDHLDKPVLLAQALAQIAPRGAVWLVGDTEADIIAAQTHGIPVVAVLSGIRDEATLKTYQPDFIQPDLAAAVRRIGGRG
ncbi:MAG: HAD family hydrolase [Gloeomargarita sp. DG02_5_bins_242]